MTIYNILLNSNNKSGGTNNSAQYYFNWSVLPQGEYKMTFDYLGGSNNLKGEKVALVNIDLGQSQTFQASSTSTSASSSRCIGTLMPYALSTTSFLYTQVTSNPIIYLKQRPSNNSFTVQLLDLTGAGFTDSTTTTIAPIIGNSQLLASSSVGGGCYSSTQLEVTVSSISIIPTVGMCVASGVTGSNPYYTNGAMITSVTSGVSGSPVWLLTLSSGFVGLGNWNNSGHAPFPVNFYNPYQIVLTSALPSVNYLNLNDNQIVTVSATGLSSTSFTTTDGINLTIPTPVYLFSNSVTFTEQTINSDYIMNINLELVEK
jgi:hypothetical protein